MFKGDLTFKTLRNLFIDIVFSSTSDYSLTWTRFKMEARW